MAENGWAIAYRQYGGRVYDPEEVVARTARRGVWSSEFVMPWDWRNGALENEKAKEPSPSSFWSRTLRLIGLFAARFTKSASAPA